MWPIEKRGRRGKLLITRKVTRHHHNTGESGVYVIDAGTSGSTALNSLSRSCANSSRCPRKKRVIPRTSAFASRAHSPAHHICTGEPSWCPLPTGLRAAVGAHFSEDGAGVGQVALNRRSEPGDQILDVSGCGGLDFQLVARECQSYEMTGHQLHSQFGVDVPQFRGDSLEQPGRRVAEQYVSRLWVDGVLIAIGLQVAQKPLLHPSFQ